MATVECGVRQWLAYPIPAIAKSPAITYGRNVWTVSRYMPTKTGNRAAWEFKENRVASPLPTERKKGKDKDTCDKKFRIPQTLEAKKYVCALRAIPNCALLQFALRSRQVIAFAGRKNRLWPYLCASATKQTRQ